MYFSKALIVLSAAVSAIATTYHVRGVPLHVREHVSVEDKVSCQAQTTVTSSEPSSTGSALTESTSSPTKKATTQPTMTASANGGGDDGDDPLGILKGDHSGDGTWYTPEGAATACNTMNKSSDLIVAVSHELFDKFPGYKGGNPNHNPVCGRKIQANYQKKSVEVTVTDRCGDCSMWSIDFTSAAFSQLADLDDGRLHGVTWHWV